jgi:hypothetical protein
MLIAFDMSLGLNGVTYPLLYRYVASFQALRVPARIAILVNLSLAVLSAYGAAWLLDAVRRPWLRRVAAAVIVPILVVEYASSPMLAVAPPPSRVDAWLAKQPPVVIVQLPLASASNGWAGYDWLYMYQGIAHRQKMLNGYSGFPPASYYAMREAMQGFPDDRSMSFLRERHVDYVVLHGSLYSPDEWSSLRRRLRDRSDLLLTTMVDADSDIVVVYAVRIEVATGAGR